MQANLKYQHFNTAVPLAIESVFDKGYGFDGKEKDNVIDVNGGSFPMAIGIRARIYDSRLGRWLSLDPLMGEYLGISPYCGIGNNPICLIDPDEKKIIIYYLEPKKDSNGNFIVGSDGNLEMENIKFEYKPGITPPDNDFVKAVVASIEYLSNSRVARKEINKAIKSEYEIKINEINPYDLNPDNKKVQARPFYIEKSATGEYDAKRDGNGKVIKNDEIYWKTDKKLALKDDDSNLTGQTQSAALGLIHELLHINKAHKNPEQSLADLKTQSKDYYHNIEEKKIIRKESKIAKQLREAIRKNHLGKEVDNGGDVKDHSPIQIKKSAKRTLLPSK